MARFKTSNYGFELSRTIPKSKLKHYLEIICPFILLFLQNQRCIRQRIFGAERRAPPWEVAVPLADVEGVRRVSDPSLPPGAALWVRLRSRAQGLYLVCGDAAEADVCFLTLALSLSGAGFVIPAAGRVLGAPSASAASDCIITLCIRRSPVLVAYYVATGLRVAKGLLQPRSALHGPAHQLSVPLLVGEMRQPTQS